jgi:hypothetical protein
MFTGHPPRAAAFLQGLAPGAGRACKSAGGWPVWTVVLAALIFTGCATRTVPVAPPPPALAVPVVPPRVLAPLPEPEAPPAAVPEAEAPATPQRPPRNPARPKPDAARDPGKPETPAETGEATPPAETKPADAGSPLRTPQTANDQQAERRIRDALGRAAKTLSQVNVQNLGADARQQYESARRFVDQADGALKAGNYMFASYLADKAEALARGLVGR